MNVRELVARTLSTPIGPIRVVACDVGLTHVELPGDGSPDRTAGPEARLLDEDESHPILDLAVRELGEYFAGARREFTVPRCAEGTEFQKEVWECLMKIPFGETWSYADVARAIDRPNAVRAVGAANGRNPIAIIVPCHRVIGADGTLTGYGGGLPTKGWLLRHEGRATPKTTQLGLFGG